MIHEFIASIPAAEDFSGRHPLLVIQSSKTPNIHNSQKNNETYPSKDL
jgi:hypothetical protein